MHACISSTAGIITKGYTFSCMVTSMGFFMGVFNTLRRVPFLSSALSELSL